MDLDFILLYISSLVDSAEWEYIIVFGIIYSSLRRRGAALVAHLLMLMSHFRNCSFQVISCCLFYPQNTKELSSIQHNHAGCLFIWFNYIDGALLGF